MTRARFKLGLTIIGTGLIMLLMLACTYWKIPEETRHLNLGIYADARLDQDEIVSVKDSIRAKFPTVSIMYCEPIEIYGDVDKALQYAELVPDQGADAVLVLLEPEYSDYIRVFFLPTPQGAAQGNRAVAFASATTVEQIFMEDHSAVVHEMKHLLGWRH